MCLENITGQANYIIGKKKINSLSYSSLRIVKVPGG